MQCLLQTNIKRLLLREYTEMDGRREDDRTLIPFSFCKLSVRPDHLHIHYRSHDSIIVLCTNKDLFCLAFVILISCVADSPLLIMAATKLKTIMLCSTLLTCPPQETNYKLILSLFPVPLCRSVSQSHHSERVSPLKLGGELPAGQVYTSPGREGGL